MVAPGFMHAAMRECTDLLAKNWKRYVRNASKYNRTVPDILPTTFYIPSDYGMWYSAACKHRGEPIHSRHRCTGTPHTLRTDWIWIVKPVGKAQGRGIFLVDAASAGKLKALTRTRPGTPGSGTDSPRVGGGGGSGTPYKSGSAAATFSSGSSKLDSMYIVSRYIDNPLLIGRRKFDLRLYVLVTSWQPLQAYIHRSGFARFCAVQYTATPKSGSGKRSAAADLDNLYMHLTNVAIQKHGEEYSATHGGKWPLESLRAHLKCTVGEAATARAFADIRSLIHHSLLAVQPSMVSAPGCFELYGYDVMLDADLAPWLIEVNASPSLSATTAHDKRRKTTLVADVLDVVMPHTRPMVPSAPAAGVKGDVAMSEHWRPAAMPQFELLTDELADRASLAAAAIRSSGAAKG